MTFSLNETHDPKAKSWVKSANADGTPFPIQNLPFGVYHSAERSRRIGIAIGESVLDLRAAIEDNLLDPVPSEVKSACQSPLLNDLMSLAHENWSELRRRLFHLLHESASSDQQQRAKAFLTPQNAVVMDVPCNIGDYTDFYAGIYHAENVGSLFRPENPLLPNYKWIPIAYHGRSSSIVISGTDISRPSGQTKPADSSVPAYAPSKRLDYELELGFYVGPGNALGTPIPIDHAEEHIFGVSLLNDWSARDIQTWEYQPLGPFLAKSFATTVSAWIVTLEALAPFRCPAFSRPNDDPKPLPYLFSEDDQKNGGIDISLEIALLTEEMRTSNAASVTISRASANNLYWTPAQFVAHHTSNGCNLRPGDLLGSGTISAKTRENVGSLLELTRQGSSPLELPNGQRRVFLEEGDEVIMRGWCHSQHYVPIGFGECKGRVVG
jgi:fumarylacetoacetase